MEIAGCRDDLGFETWRRETRRFAVAFPASDLFLSVLWEPSRVLPGEGVTDVAVALDLGRRRGVFADVAGSAVVVTGIFASPAQVCESMRRAVVVAVAVFSRGQDRDGRTRPRRWPIARRCLQTSRICRTCAGHNLRAESCRRSV